MEYLVMECHKSYAVVLDHQGRFKKVANLGYQVGQEVADVVELREPKSYGILRWQPLLSAAACLCIVFLGVWQMALLSMGTVLIQINPQIRLNVNRMERVISAEALNPDGAKVLFDYHAFGKTVEQAAQELSDRAASMGYLADGGQVHLTVDSRDEQWRTETERRLQAVIVHDAENITIIIDHEELEELVEDLVEEILDANAQTQPVPAETQPEPSRGNGGHHDDDDHDDHDDDDDDDDDDDEPRLFFKRKKK